MHSPSKADVLVYRSDAHSTKLDYGGTSLHYETLVGNKWVSPSIEGDMRFVLLGSNSSTHAYSTLSLANEIETYDNQSPSTGLGWNSFLNYEQAAINYNLTQMISAYSGRTFVWYTGVQPNLVASIPRFNGSYVLFGDSGAGGPIGCPPTQSICGGTAQFWSNDATDKVIGELSAPAQASWLSWSSFW